MKARELINRHPKIKDTLLYTYYTFFVAVYHEYLRGMFHSIYLHFPNNKYSNLKRFKDIHKGGMCFIIGTGPSLRIEDLEKLKQQGVCSFSMNSIIKVYGQTEWRPNYYGIQDLHVYRTLKSCYKESDFVDTEVFYGDEIRHFPIEKGHKFYVNQLWHWNKFKKPYYKFSIYIDRQIYEGHTVSYSLLQLAVFMGFSEIYFLGVDANYPATGKTHFSEFMDEDFINRTRGMGPDQIAAFEYASNYLQNSGVHIYNATRGGCLEVFPRVNFDELWT